MTLTSTIHIYIYIYRYIPGMTKTTTMTQYSLLTRATSSVVLLYINKIRNFIESAFICVYVKSEC